MGFPELAAGDAQKALSLCKNCYNEIDEGLIEFRKSGGTESAMWAQRNELHAKLFPLRISAERCLVDSLDKLYDFWEILEVCKAWKTRSPEVRLYRDRFKVFKQRWQEKRSLMKERGFPTIEMNKRLTQGAALFRPYPFMAMEYMDRPNWLITNIRESLEKLSTGRCTLSSSKIPNIAKSSNLGIFATSDMDTGTVLFKDFSLMVASSVNPFAPQLSNARKVCELCCDFIEEQQGGTVSCDSCPAEYCDSNCRMVASVKYHKALCGKNFSWIYDVWKGKEVDTYKAVEGAFWLRILAICVQADCHPLEQELIARLSSPYESAIPREWSLFGNVDRLNQILDQLGVDVYADLRYDTWVLQTVWGRILNNSEASLRSDGRFVRTLGSLWSFLNHSCEPNAAIHQMQTRTGNDVQAAVAVLETKKPIKKGEEIFISYGNYSGVDRASRQQDLQGWLPNGCRCTKCERGD